MKTLQIDKIIEELREIKIEIHPDFLKQESIDVPIIRQVDILLDAVGEKGLKLTNKGNLPTRVVQELTLCCPTLSGSRFLQWTKRFLEEEQVAAQRARVVSEAGKLLKVSKGKIRYSTMTEAYRQSSDAEKFIYLLWQFASRVNLAYFDRAQEVPLVNDISLVMLQIVRDRPAMFREPKVYDAFLLNALPHVADMIFEEVAPASYVSDDPVDTFDWVVELRLFRNFYAPFGLIEEQGVHYQETYECRKTPLLEALLMPLDVVDTDVVLSKKALHAFEQRVKKEQLDIDLFHDFCFLYVRGMHAPLKPVSVIVDELIMARKVIGVRADAERKFFMDFGIAIDQTLRYFTRLEVKGGGDRGDEMHRQFLSWIDGLYALLPKQKPFAVIEAMRSTVFFFLDSLTFIYDIDTSDRDFLGQCARYFDEETIQDIGALVITMGDLEKKGKKLKRVNHKFETMAKEALTAFVLAIMSIHTAEMDKE